MGQPKSILDSWRMRAGLSNTELGRLVRERAAAQGDVHVLPDATAVRRWLDGGKPRRPVPDLLADLISDRVGFRVTTYDLGLGEPSGDRALIYHRSWSDALESVADLGRADVDRRKFLTAAPFAAIAGLGPSRDWLLNTLDQLPHDTQPVRLDDIKGIRDMFSRFQEMDIFQGGGSGRMLLAAYMNEHVFPLLRRTHKADVQYELYSAAAEQTYLLGWMAFDNGEHGIAQRYLIQALRLAEESRDPALGAHVLAGMADQATLLGNPVEGRRLAQAGRHGLGTNASQACLADLWTLEARALAAVGDKTATVAAIAHAEQAFARVDSGTEPEWARFIDHAYVHGEIANAFRDIDQPAEASEHARKSIQCAKTQGRARRGAMSHAALAAAHLQQGDLEAAYAAGIRTVNLSKKVKSSRSMQAVRDVQHRLRATAADHPLVREFVERAQTALAV
ncbi:transcriptional regulator [Nocardia cyriacigeorgica]|uniref:transcriptional regulator n=1 Tax=Nocardia cyriacigeorgica TaxID=135487 RepID=UPI0018949CF6|nr:transcriptional regulator [Nocardia cyriacigeorgica]MBF6512864.1 transcriptional regulator [Nocardia cyriacigeorgica]